MPRLSVEHLTRLHQALSEPETLEINDSQASVTDYKLAHTPHHCLLSGNIEQAATILTEYSKCNYRLEKYGSDDWVEDIETTHQVIQKGISIQSSSDMSVWESFAREKKHILARGDNNWPHNKILLQLAVEHADDSPVTIAAENWLKTGECYWPWLRNQRREEQARSNPCLKVIEEPTGLSGVTVLNQEKIVSWHHEILKIWALENGLSSSSFSAHSNNIHGINKLSNGYFISWSADNTLRLWSPDEGLVSTFEGHTGKINGVIELPNGNYLSWSDDKTLRIWNDAGETVTTLHGHLDCVIGATVSNDNLICSWSDDFSIRLWALDGTLLSVLNGHVHKINGVKAIGSHRLLSWSDDQTLRLWSTEGQLLRLIEGHTDKIIDVDVFSSGYIMTISWKELLLWDSNGNLLVDLEQQHGFKIIDESHFLTWLGGECSYWSISEGIISFFEDSMPEILGLKLLDNDRVLTWSFDNNLKIWSLDGELEAVLRAHSSDIEDVFPMGNNNVLSWSADKTIRLWSTESQPSSSLEMHTDNVDGLIQMNSDQYLSWSYDHTLKIWDDEGYCLSTMIGHEDIVIGARLLPGKRILSHSVDGTMRIWSYRGDCLDVITGHGDCIHGAFVLDNGRILSWSEDTTMRLWDDYGKEIRVFEGHSDSIEYAFVFNHDLIVTLGHDNTVFFWNLDGEIINTPNVLEPENLYINVSDHGQIKFDDGSELLWSKKGETTLIRHNQVLHANKSWQPDDLKSSLPGIASDYDITINDKSCSVDSKDSAESLRLKWQGDFDIETFLVPDDKTIILTGWREIVFLALYKGNKRVSLPRDYLQ